MSQSPIDSEPPHPKSPPPGKLFPCPGCGAKVEFDPRTRALKCPYCGHTAVIPETEADFDAVVERDFEEYLAKQSTAGDAIIAGRSTQTRCTGCGAMVLLEDKVVTEECPFCGTHLENKPEHAEAMIPPESLLPFAVDLRHARTAFDRWLHGLWFAPSELKKVANLGRLSGVYVPYWTYDAMTYTRYRGERGEDYQDTETYTTRDAQGNTVTKTRTVTRTRWYPASGQVEHFFDDVLVCGSKSMPPHLISYLEPWDLESLEGFRPEFLSGFKTERYAVALKEGFDEARLMMGPEIESLIRRDIGGDRQRIDWKKTKYFAITFKHLLLPVWVANYRYHDRLFQIIINGRNGKLSGERPYSWWKIIGLVAAILLAIVLILAIMGLTASKASGGGPVWPPPQVRVALDEAAEPPRPLEPEVAQVDVIRPDVLPLLAGERHAVFLPGFEVLHDRVLNADLRVLAQ